MAEEIESIFEDGLLSLFDHHPVAFSTPSPSDPYIYRPSPVPLSPQYDTSRTTALPDLQVPVYLPVAPSALHSTLQLTHIWLSSVLMADLIFSHAIDIASGSRVCELGAGAGLPSIAALLVGDGLGGNKDLVKNSQEIEEQKEPVQVVVTDYAVPETPNDRTSEGLAQPEDVLGVLRHNLDLAFLLLPTSEPSLSPPLPTYSVLGHTWGEDTSTLLSSPSRPKPNPEPFDLILLADLLWSTSSHTTLITSLYSLLRPSTGVAHVIAGLHQGRGATERFKSGWKEMKGGWVREVDEFRWGVGGWERFERVSGVEGEGERGVVVWFTVGKDV